MDFMCMFTGKRRVSWQLCRACEEKDHQVDIDGSVCVNV